MSELNAVKALDFCAVWSAELVTKIENRIMTDRYYAALTKRSRTPEQHRSKIVPYGSRITSALATSHSDHE